MNNPVTDFMEKTKGLTNNPLGIIGLFVSSIYGVACLVLGTGLNNLHGSGERLPLIWFIIIFPFVVLGVFTYLVICHHQKLYAPKDYKDEKNFVSTFLRTKEVVSDLEELKVQLKSLKTEENSEQLIASISKIFNDIEKIKEKSEKIPINNLWWLNHWGSNYASIVGDKMIFTGTSVQTPQGTDGSHLDLNYILEIGKTYEISCFAKSDTGTTGMFQLWCHDDTGVKPDGVNVLTPFKTPSIKGEKIKLNFKADYNKSIRIHLQYTPGQGRIEISDVRISELKI
ncbi:MAG: hypothetical protein NT010_11725 [Proteobacteria bacterium]|nr:hypothetical protein [Pseudomonadota bacterium]